MAGGEDARVPPRGVRPGAGGRGRGSWNKRPNNGVMAQILLAEDDASMREFLAKALRNAGHHVVAVGDGLDAMESLDGFRADLLLADVVMPGLDGIRSEEHTSELQSLMRTSYAVYCLKKKT